MGLNRATFEEAEELANHKAFWWEEFCASIAEHGQEAIRAEVKKRKWSWGGLWKWISVNEERNRDYQRALEAHVQLLALETVPIADRSEDAKLQVDTRFKLAGKVDRARWGDNVTHSVSVDSFGEMLKAISDKKLQELKQQQQITEKVINP